MTELLAFGAVGAVITGYLQARRSGPKTATSQKSDDDASLSRFGLGYAIRHLFPTNFEYVHLNHGSYGVTPWPVMKAARKIMEGIEAFPDDFMRRNALRRFREASNVIGNFVHAPKDSVVFVENATAAVNVVLNSLRLKAGDAILINNHTYNACKNAAYWTAEKCGAEVLTQQIDLPQAGPAQILAEFAAYLDAHPNIRFALIDHISSPTAIVMPVKEMCAAARSRGVRIMVDGAHAPGMMDISMGDIGADWYTGNLHKWCFCLKGTAFLYTAPERQAETQSLIISHFWKLGYTERFFMQGTNDQSRYLSAPVALDFMKNQLGGVQAMRDHNRRLALAAAALLRKAWGTEGSYLVPQQPVDLTAPFLIPVELPLDWKVWTRVKPSTAAGAAAAAETDATRLSDADAEAALWADDGFNERIATAIFKGYRVQPQTFAWKVNGKVKVRKRSGSWRVVTVAGRDAASTATAITVIAAADVIGSYCCA